MSTLSQQLLIAKCWLASFLRKNWQPEHYPVYVRQQASVPDDSRWCAQVLNWPGPIGLGATEQRARAELFANLQATAAELREDGKPVPRPGTHVPIQSASTVRVRANPALLDESIRKALGFRPGYVVFISDESEICDFGNEYVCEIRANIQEHFGVVGTRRDLIASLIS
jgi:predicted RNase H-like HicB family nuclease